MTENRSDSDHTTLPSASFVHAVRHALRHLYDPEELRRSPLLLCLPVERQHAPGLLQGILIDAIEALKPKAAVSPQSSAWQTYYTLSARYVQQYQQSEVAKDLALSPRQLRRRDTLGIRLLAGYLWSRYDLQDKPPHRSTLAPGVPARSGAAMASRQSELQWLERSATSEPVALGEVMEALLQMVQPMARDLGVRLEWAMPADLPRLIVPLPALRQALLSVLTATLRCVPGGNVSAVAEARRGQVVIDVRATPRQCGVASLPEDQRENIAMARQLAVLVGGSLEVAPANGIPGDLVARLILAAAEQAVVLVVDDNVDALQLVQRYLTGTRYAFVGAHDAGQALALAEKVLPRVIILDVMLPSTDGWELLGRFREHPSLRAVPVIVCTILAQEQLAFALGAAAFLRKPVSRPDLLAALDRHSGPQSPGSG